MDTADTGAATIEGAGTVMEGTTGGATGVATGIDATAGRGGIDRQACHASMVRSEN